MKILVTGSSGVLGHNIVNYLLDQNFDDLVLADISEFDHPRANHFPFHKGDIRDPEFAKQIIKGVDMVVHSAAASPSFADEIVYSTIIDGTKNLLEAAYEEKVKRFVYLSSTSVYGIPKKAPVTEDFEHQPYDAYNKSKKAAEGICQEYRDKGMCIPILRPRTFIGPGRLGSFILLFEWAREGKNFPMVGKGINKYQFLDVEDLCQAVYLCLVQPEDKVNDLFNIGAKDFMTMKEDYQSVLDAAGYGKKIISLPAKPINFLLGLLYKLKLSPLYERLYKKLTLDYYVSIEKAEKQLGYKPKYSNQASLVRNFKWYLDNYKSFSKQEGSSNSVPWKQGMLRFAKVFF